MGCVPTTAIPARSAWDHVTLETLCAPLIEETLSETGATHLGLKSDGTTNYNDGYKAVASKLRVWVLEQLRASGQLPVRSIVVHDPSTPLAREALGVLTDPRLGALTIRGVR